jgi:hypothetical protein
MHSHSQRAKKPLNIVAAMNSRLLFGPSFIGTSWDTWRAVLRAAFAEKMTKADIERFRSVADREPPQKRVQELIAVVGRGGGKDSVASLIATYLAMSFHGRLRPGERAVIVCLAVDRDQARIVLRYINAYFETIPTLTEMVEHVNDDGIELTNGVDIVVSTNSYRAVRGRTLLCCIFDEVAFWRDENSANPDVEVHGAVTPGLARCHGSILIMISSAHRRAGLLYERWRDYYSKNDDDVLVVKGTTLQFNPTFPSDKLERDLERDPARFGAEYNGVWRDDLATFISRDLIDSAVDRGVTVRPPQKGVRYIAGCDPSGGTGKDSFTFAVAHRDENEVVLDLLYERRSPFNPSEVVAEIKRLLTEYRLRVIEGDRYAAAWVIEAFAKEGVKYIQSERDRSEVYGDVLPLFTSGCARLLDNPKCAAQFAALERRTFPTGKDRINHPEKGGHHDDLANSAAIALTLAAAKPVAVGVSDSTMNWLRAASRHQQVGMSHDQRAQVTLRGGGPRAMAQLQKRRGW